VQRQVGSSGAFHETIIVRVKAELKEGGAGPGTNWKRKSSGTPNQQCRRRSFCAIQRSPSLAARFIAGYAVAGSALP
jgi:hypothetical protein